MHFRPQEVNIYAMIVDIPFAVLFVKPVKETLENQ